MQIELVPINSLVFDPSNARKHNQKNINAIKGSLARFKQQKPIVVNYDNVVIAGNGTLQAAIELKWKDIAVVRTDLDGSDLTAFGLADNRSSELAEWDLDNLGGLLKSLQDEDFNLDSIGFDNDDLQKMIAQEIAPGNTDDDAVPEDVETRCKPGDLWILGNHRLLCGDSTNIQHVERLMNGEKADMVFTDPPYNYGGNTACLSPSWAKGHKELAVAAWDKDFKIEDIFGSIEISIADNCAIYIFTSHFLAPAIWDWMKVSLGFYGWLVWCKPNPMPSFIKKDWTWAAELICYGRKGKPIFNYPDGKHALNWWQINIKTSGREHPTQKPVEVPTRAIEMHSQRNHIILDLFLGSGSTLIACEKTNRKCYAMEIDQHYCDVILRRWEDYTGKQAILDTLQTG